eukprot:2970551-Ditylum_brightwellii.AAC.1
MEYDVPPIAQHSMKCMANPYVTSISYKSPTKKIFSDVIPTVAVAKPTAVACPVINESVFSTPSGSGKT